jgi:hypothetical protein
MHVQTMTPFTQPVSLCAGGVMHGERDAGELIAAGATFLLRGFAVDEEEAFSLWGL